MEPLCRIRDIYRAINDFETEFSARYNVKLNEGMLLCSLSKNESCSSGEIADLLGLTPSNSSKIILSVEKKGLIQRAVGMDDKRQMFFTLTDKGREQIDIIRSESDSINKLIEVIKDM